MATVDLFAIGNALIDQEFKISDDFLIQQGLQKGTMQLTDGPTQAHYIKTCSILRIIKVKPVVDLRQTQRSHLVL
jgi:hypothetical protein